MDLDMPTASTGLVTWDEDCESTPSISEVDSEAWLSSIKKKIDDFERDNQLAFPGSELSDVARIDIGNECEALREMVIHQQKAIQDLSSELDEERNASSSAANETMSMMLRLQKDKAEIQMEFRQFKRYAEEKMAHDQYEISAMEDLLYKREMAIESLYAEVQAYRHKMKSYGLVDFEVDEEKWAAILRDNSANPIFYDHANVEAFNYPPLRCSLNQSLANAEVDEDVIDIDKYAFGDTPRSRDQLKDLEHRINQLERSPRPNFPDDDFPGLDNAWERVIVGPSQNQPRHTRRISTDSTKSFVIRETGSDLESPRLIKSQIKELRKGYNGSESGDDMSEKVCTIDLVREGNSTVSTPRGVSNEDNAEDPEIKKLYMRLQALEADRESMRKTLNAMQTDKAQVVLLKEIAQQLCKEMPPSGRVPKKKPSLIRKFSFISVVTLMVSFIFWRKKSCKTKIVDAGRQGPALGTMEMPVKYASLMFIASYLLHVLKILRIEDYISEQQLPLGNNLSDVFSAADRSYLFFISFFHLSVLYSSPGD